MNFKTGFYLAFFLAITIYVASVNWMLILAIPFGAIVAYINYKAIQKGKVGKIWHTLQFLILLAILIDLALFGLLHWSELLLVTSFYYITFETVLNRLRKLPWNHVGRTAFWDRSLWVLVENPEPTRWKWLNKQIAKRIYGRQWFPGQMYLIIKLFLLFGGLIMFRLIN